MNRAFRPRPIDFSRAMPVVRSQNELELNDEGVLVPKKDLLINPLEDDLGNDDEDMETIRILNEQYEKESKKANIPVPPIQTVEDYDKHVAKDFTRPQSYLRFKALTEKEMDEILEYEMDEQDMDFVNKTLPGMKMTIKEDRFEQIVDRLEKESGKNSGKLAEINVLDTYKLGGGKVVTQVYDYWMKKRNKLGKALLRRYQPPTSINDTSPHSTFRPREKEEKRIRRTRKNDKDAHKKLKHLQEDFRRAKDLLERIVRREKTKKVLLELDFCLQFAKDIKDIPPQILQQHDAFFKELQREKARQAAIKKGIEGGTEEEFGGAAPNQRPRPAAVHKLAGAVPGEEEAKAADTGIPPEKVEAIKRCFQLLMRDWGGANDEPGTSLLPVTEDAKFAAGTGPSTGDALKIRGRARVGRGGRVVFDRSSAWSMGHSRDGGEGEAGLKRHRDGGMIGDMRSAWVEMQDKSQRKAAKCNWNWGLGQVPKPAGQSSAQVVALPHGVTLAGKAGEGGGQRGGTGMNGVGNGPAGANDVKKRTLGYLSGLWGKVAGPETLSWDRTNINCNATDSSVRPLMTCSWLPSKRLKLEEHETSAASTASTTAGAE